MEPGAFDMVPAPGYRDQPPKVALNAVPEHGAEALTGVIARVLQELKGSKPMRNFLEKYAPDVK